jgi:hypothetical protein
MTVQLFAFVSEEEKSKTKDPVQFLDMFLESGNLHDKCSSAAIQNAFKPMR